MPTAAELRANLTAAKAGWSIDHRLADSDLVPRHPLGADLTQAQKVETVPRLDITPFLKAPTSNPFLLRRRMDRGLIARETVQPELLARLAVPNAAPAPIAGATPQAGGAGSASAVDWRNRFGWPWLTRVKDQDPCESCWCFSAVGVVEAMTRIEHCVWSLRSEGDVHDGMGTRCSDTGWPTHAFDWMKANGVADPGCWAYETTNAPYHPTADRAGRTVRLTDYVTLSSIDDQKAWIDCVGPLSACFTVYDDFFGYGPNSGVYTRTNNTVAGGHCIVIVGYDDAKQAWLIRNSWGEGWGMTGYCWFGYGQCDIDANAKYGVAVADVSPDPWSKRRLHAGALYESGDGALHRNFEVWTPGSGGSIRHYWRDGSSLNWSLAETLANDCASAPSATGTTYNRNFEYIYQTTGGRLHHRFFDQAGGQWRDGGVFGPTNVGGVPAFIQGDYGAPGNFEVVVRLSDGTLQHWWRMDGPPWTWAASATFGANVAYSGPTMVQRPDEGLDLAVVNANGTMQRYWRDDPHGMVWRAAETFGQGIACVPVMIEGQYSAGDETMRGNYELCVQAAGAIQHWWRDNNGSGAWSHSATFGANVAQVLGLIESSFGFDLEVVAQLEDGGVQHFWRDGAGWHAGPVFGSVR